MARVSALVLLVAATVLTTSASADSSEVASSIIRSWALRLRWGGRVGANPLAATSPVPAKTHHSLQDGHSAP
jgi:hypothetical protein